MNIYPRRLNLKSSHNIRELGGYMRADKKVTKYGQFLRGDMTSFLDTDDTGFLLEYGLKTVIDLRDADEISWAPDAFADMEGVLYKIFPISEGAPDLTEVNVSLYDLYLYILKESTHIGNIFNFMAENADGAILFHCSVGKDRTGIIACLLLMLAGIDKSDIIADYEVSYTYAAPLFALLLKEYPNMPQHLMMSEPAWIANAMTFLEKEYGSAEKLLLSRGVTQKNIDILRNKLID